MNKAAKPKGSLVPRPFKAPLACRVFDKAPFFMSTTMIVHVYNIPNSFEDTLVPLLQTCTMISEQYYIWPKNDTKPPRDFPVFVDRAKMTESETKMTLQRVQHVYYAMKQADSLQLSGSEVRQHST